MEIEIISLVAFFAAILTFFSGFGLGTILTPEPKILIIIIFCILINSFTFFIYVYPFFTLGYKNGKDKK